MKGKILDNNTNTPIAGATIDFEYGPWFLRGFSDYDGNYEMHVPINKTMKISIHKDSVNLHEGHYHVRVFLGDKNDEKFDFVVDLDQADGMDPKVNVDLMSFTDTIMIDLKVKNDLRKNETINTISEINEQEWVDSLNALYASGYKNKVDFTASNDIIYFEFDKYQLSDSSITTLDQFIENLKQKNFNYLEITGHADVRGTKRHNLKLSINRAKQVYNYLNQNGIGENLMIFKGLGSEEAVLNEESEQAYAKNRRVEIKIIE